MPKPTPRDTDPESLRQHLISFVSDPDYQPVQSTELLRQLRIPPAERHAVEDVIRRLLCEGVLVLLKHKGLAAAKSADLVLGKISFTKSGAAFVNPVKEGTEVFIPAADTGTAMPGDQVLVRISRREGRDGKHPARAPWSGCRSAAA